MAEDRNNPNADDERISADREESGIGNEDTRGRAEDDEFDDVDELDESEDENLSHGSE